MQRGFLGLMRCPEPHILPIFLLSRAHAPSHVSSTIQSTYGNEHIQSLSPHQTGLVLREKSSGIAEHQLCVRHHAGARVPSFSQQTCKIDTIVPDAGEETKTQKSPEPHSRSLELRFKSESPASVPVPLLTLIILLHEYLLST